MTEELDGKVCSMWLVSCSKCQYEQEHTEVSLEEIKKFRKEWNEKYRESMRCVHDYQYKLLEENIQF